MCNHIEVYNLLKRYYGSVTTALKFKDNYQLLIAVILSAQSTDDQVNKATEKLFKKYPDPASLAQAKETEVGHIIRGIGLHHNKSHYIIHAAKKIQSDFAGEIPGNLEDLMCLPGVGRKSASVVLAVGFGIPAFPVDTHVFRVSRRLGIAMGEHVEQVEEEIKKVFPLNFWLDLHHLLIAHGRTFCLARKPRCRRCPLYNLCPSRK